MLAEEYAKALEMLHPLEGLELYLSSLKDRVKAIEPKKRGDMLLSIQAAERVRRHALVSLHELLSDSERIENERMNRGALMISQAKAQGRTEVLDQLATTIAEHRKGSQPASVLTSDPSPAKTRAKPRGRRK